MWFYNNIEVTAMPEDIIGFVYLITNVIDGKKYIGKKNGFKTIVRPPLKGQKRKRRSIVDSDWKDYWSSSDELKRDVEIHGKDNFKREILRYCSSKSELAYYEAKLQFDTDALLRDDYYNGIINLRVRCSKALKDSFELDKKS